jgi:hypothetical protein
MFSGYQVIGVMELIPVYWRKNWEKTANMK